MPIIRPWHNDRERQMQEWSTSKWSTARNKRTPPTKCQCCNETGRKIEGHHPSYFNPLQVVWVCSRCHAKIASWTVAIERIKMSLPKRPARKRTTHSITLPAELVEQVQIEAKRLSNGFQPPFSRIVEIALLDWLTDRKLATLQKSLTPSGGP